MPRTKLLPAALLGLAIATLVAAAPLHPRLEKSTPAANSRLALPPAELSLTFNEAPELALTRLTLRRGDAAVALEALRVAEGDPRTVTAKPKAALAAGRYTLRWQVTGSDGHPVRGEFGFEVLPSEAAAGARSAPEGTR